MVLCPLTSYLSRWRVQSRKLVYQMSRYGSSATATTTTGPTTPQPSPAQLGPNSSPILPSSIMAAPISTSASMSMSSSSSSGSGGGEACPKADGFSENGGSSSSDDCDVNFSTCGCKALIMLNRPKQMNALNHCMARKILFMLNKWKCDKTAIVLKGYGNAFCAGGDVVSIAKDTTGQLGKNFFRDEYKLNALISTLKVPYISLYNGVVMGGGVGLSIHGRYRVATECSVFAMPETQIGFFPDVGVSHFLSRMPNNLGLFLGLTGYRLKGYDLVHTGIATHFCVGSKFCDLEKELLGEDKKCVDDILKHYHDESVKSLCGGQVPLFTLEGNMPIIMSCFCADTMEEIMAKLECDPCPLSKDILAVLKKCSPLALKVTLKQIKEACQLDLFEVLNTDFRIASRFMEGKDFYEGVRAMLIDKDKNPKWQHQQVCQVSDEEVCCYFKPLPPELELCLPASLEQM